jgi:hypothetical protein
VNVRLLLQPIVVRGIAAVLVLLAATVASTHDVPVPTRHFLACGAGITLPRTVTVMPGADGSAVRASMAEWNRFYGNVFVEVPTGGDVQVIADRTTWVEMPCEGGHSVVHMGIDVSMAYWLTHELGHTLGLADHIRSSDDASRYINPGFCPGDGYEGVMSYCTPRARWFGPDDVEMMRTVFPRPGPCLPVTVTVSGIACDR